MPALKSAAGTTDEAQVTGLEVYVLVVERGVMAEITGAPTTPGPEIVLPTAQVR